MIRDTIKAAQISAMKAGEKDKLAAVRLILAKIKDRDIELRGLKAAAEGRSQSQDFEGKALPADKFKEPVDDDALVVEVLQKMVKQRRESITLYEQGGRDELAAVEKGELAIIETFLPAQLSEDETKAVIEAIKAEVSAESVKDMGRVMAVLKERHGSEIDMSKASGLVKAVLG